eukprot:XP_020398288.1 atherin-like [Zea mays]
MRAAWQFVRPVAGTPTAGSGSPMRRLEASSLPVWLPAPPSRPPAPWTRAKGLQAVPPPQVAPGCRRKRGNIGCAAPTGHLYRTPQKRQRTADGAEEAGSQAQGAQRHVSPPPPPPSGPPPPQPPPPSGLPPPLLLRPRLLRQIPCPGAWLPAAGVCWEWRRRSALSCCNCTDDYRSPNDGDVVEYTIGSSGGGPNYAYPHHRGQRGGHVQLYPTAHSGGDEGGLWAAAPLEERTKAVSLQFASERSELERDRKDYKKDLQKVYALELEASRKEKRLAKREEALNQWEEVVTELSAKLSAMNEILEEQRI